MNEEHENRAVSEGEVDDEDVIRVEDMDDDELYRVPVVAPGAFWKWVYGVLQELPGWYPGGLNEFLIESVRRRLEDFL